MKTILNTTLLLTFLVIPTCQQNYDEDINLAYPVTIYYRTVNVYSPEQVHTLDNVNNCTCKELSGQDTHCSGTSCKLFPSQINTTTKYFKLKLTSITTIHKDDFLSISNITNLDINANVKLSTIEPGCFRRMTNLKNLSLVANMNLKYLAPNIFEGLVNVEQMYFQKNGFNQILDVTQTLAMKFVPRLVLLDMSESMFHYIKYDEFHPMNGTILTQLNLILCELEFVHPNCLLPLKNLTTLLLGQNIFNVTSLTQLIQNTTKSGIPINYLSLYDTGLRKTIPNQLMVAIGASNITSLSLAYNHFDYIDEFDFPYMPNLIDLDLRSDYIEDIAENAFNKLPALRYLRLGENKLFRVPKGALAQKITYLDIAGNTIEGIYFSMQDQVFAKMEQLESLQMSYNSIYCLTNQSLVGLTNLKKLNLKKSDLHHIDEGSFSHMKKLLHLNLMENPILPFCLTPGMFEGLENLQVLLLGGCNIKNLTSTPNLFTNMPNLTYLGLEKTNLHTIFPNQLSHLTRLRTLNLADNKLAAWSKSILPHQQKLKFLFAQQNKISYVTNAMMDDWQNLDALYLDGNPFSCDCSLYSVVTWLNKNKISLNFVEGTDEVVARCIFPETWRQKSVVQFLRHLRNDSSQCIVKSSVAETVALSVLGVLILFIVAIILLCVYRKYLKKHCGVKLYI